MIKAKNTKRDRKAQRKELINRKQAPKELPSGELLKRAKKLLTPTVMKQADYLKKSNKRRFQIWIGEKRTGLLPEGIPYKITENPEILETIGSLVAGLNQPLILVSSRLNNAEQLEVARHELREWATRRRTEKMADDAHQRAKKMGNRKLIKSARKKQIIPIIQ